MSKAQVANGALPAPVSIYGMLGISTDTYRAKNIQEYSKNLANMDLLQLQEEAYEVGIAAFGNRANIIDRLERKYLQETTKYAGVGQETADDMTPELREQGMKAMRKITGGL